MSDWTKTTLGEIANFQNGFAFKPEDWGQEGLPIIRIQNLTGTSEALNKTNRVVPEQYHVDCGDLLFSWSASLGVFIWDRGEALLNQHIFKVTPSNRVERDFLFFLLKSQIVKLLQKTHGSTMRHVTKRDFERTVISLPPLPEQRRIVDILNHADSICRLRRQAEQKASEIIPALFIEMFGDPVENPRGWELRPLGEVLTRIDGGWSPKCGNRPAKEEEWGVLKLSAVTYGNYRPSENKILPDTLSPRAEIKVHVGDVLFTRKNTRELVGAVAYVEEAPGNLMLADTIFRLVPNETIKMTPRYLWAVLGSSPMRPTIQALATGAANSMPNISKARLKTIPIPLPPVEMQRLFAERVEAIRATQAQQTRMAETAEATLQALMARYFDAPPELAAA